MPLFKKDFSSWGQKEKTIQTPPPPPRLAIAASQSSQWTLYPQTPLSPPPPPPSHPPPPLPMRPQVTYHSTLLLLERANLPQEPRGYWASKQVEETPSSRNAKGRPIFDPETPARIAQRKLARETRTRKREREERSLQAGWFDGPAQNIAHALEDLEDVQSEIREVARWDNSYLLLREQRRAVAPRVVSRHSWFGGGGGGDGSGSGGKESAQERDCRLAVEAGLQGIRGLEWTRQFEPQSFAQTESSSAASIRSLRLTPGPAHAHRRTNSSASVSAAYPSAPVSPVAADTRLSILSLATTQSTPRSSIMSTGGQSSASSASSPVSSVAPSPALGPALASDGDDHYHRKAQPPWNDDALLPPPSYPTGLREVSV